MENTSAVRNPEGIWINSQVFREEGSKFMKYGSYCSDPWGSPSWYEYWTEQRKRCLHGYTVGGVKIPGEYYFYLNFCPIRKSKKSSGAVSFKQRAFPDFWDGDYNYFWTREIARRGVLESSKLSEKEQSLIYQLPPEEREDELIKIYNSLGLYFNVVPSLVKKDLRVENLLGGKDVIVLKSRRKGFEQPNSEIVMTPSGPSTMGELKIGDMVLTPTGKAKILEYYQQGRKDVYEIELYDGRKVRCGLNHLWKVTENNGKTKKVVDTEYLLNKNLKPKKAFTTFLDINKPVEYPNTLLPIPAYTLGAILGDGNVSKQFKLSGIDNEIFNRVLSEIRDSYFGGIYTIGFEDKCNKQFKFDCASDIKNYYKTKYKISKFANRVNPVYEELRLLKLDCTSNKKYIPNEYKYSSIEQRLDLVKGLMDTDGTIAEDGACSFSNVSKRLVKDLQEVLYSLSITSTFRTRKDGLYIIYINTNRNIFHISRKVTRVKYSRKVRSKIAIVNVKKLEYKENSSCILIDSKDHLYLTKDYIITHNSYKNASVGVNSFFHRPGAYTMLMAYDKKYLYPKGIFSMSMDYINFINDNTGWTSPSDFVRKQDHIKNSYKKYNNGVEVETGMLSEIQAITFKDNPQAGVGKDCYDIIGEEVGAWGTPGGLKETVASMLPSITDGSYKTGMMTLFGTANDIEKGTVDFASMFENPEANNFLAFKDVWGDSSVDKTEGFFFPVQLNLVGHYDEQGNSNITSALEEEEKERKKKVAGGATSTELAQRMREFPTCSAEALSSISVNSFPVVELKRQTEIVKAKKLQLIKGMPVNLIRDDENILRAKPILDNKVEPITSYKNIPLDPRGCVMIYEYPVKDAPKGLYKIGYDPVRQDTGTSLAGIIVYKSAHRNSFYHNIIVAEYIGRKETSEDIDKIAAELAIFYNTKLMYENEVTSVKNYFRRTKRLDLLAVQPDKVISKNVKKSNVARVYGCHMSEQLKDAGERYVKDWLLTVLDFDENGNPITVIDRIYSLRLLEELINYNRKGNYDLVSALFMCMFQVQEEELGKEYDDDTKVNSKIQEWKDLMNNMGE